MKVNSVKVILVLGGARSGKSSFAQRLAEENEGALVYLATAQAFDAEMVERIARHRSDRSARWQTVECPLNLTDAISANQKGGRTIRAMPRNPFDHFGIERLRCRQVN